jgi:hypothetical protein
VCDSTCGDGHGSKLLTAEVSRRAVLVGALAASAGAALAGLAEPRAVAAATRLQRDPVLDGAIDLHVHSAPDVDARVAGDPEVAAAYAEAGARAILLKNHYLITSDRAYLARMAAPDVEVFGGIVLNKQVGGLNPAAIRAMAGITGKYGKVVWFPTRDAENHLRVDPREDTPVKVTDAGGELLPEARECLRVIAGENLALFSGHIAPAEVLALFREAKAAGVTKMMVTHAMAPWPNMTIDQMKEVAALGGLLELVALFNLPTAPLGATRAPADYAEAIKAVGAQHFVLSTDLGQAVNPIHPIGFKTFLMEMMQAGVTEDEIRTMTRGNPARMLDLV